MKKNRRLVLVVLTVIMVVMLTGCDMMMRTIMPKHYYEAFVLQMQALDFESMNNEFYKMQPGEREYLYDDFYNCNVNGLVLYNVYNNPVTRPDFSTEFEKNVFDFGMPGSRFAGYRIRQTPKGWTIYYRDGNGDHEMPRRFHVADASLFNPAAPETLNNCGLTVSRSDTNMICFVFNREYDANSFILSYNTEIQEQLKASLGDDVSTKRVAEGYEYIRNYQAICKLYEYNMYGKYIVELMF